MQFLKNPLEEQRVVDFQQALGLPKIAKTPFFRKVTFCRKRALFGGKKSLPIQSHRAGKHPFSKKHRWRRVPTQKKAGRYGT